MTGASFRPLLVGELLLGLVAFSWAVLSGDTFAFELDGESLLLATGLTLAVSAVNFGLFFASRDLDLIEPVRSFFEESVFPLVRSASVVELLVAAALAGFAEELLFRGLLQPRIGLVAASLLFGLAHGPTLSFLPLAAWAAVFGLFFGVLYQWSGNLAQPMLVHAGYDALAFLYIHYRWTPKPAAASMSSVSPLSFAKTQAHGNDFLLVSEEELSLEQGAEVARRICDRLRGIGADGLILYRGSGPRFFMTVFNSDGSRAELSGNGLRCLAAYLLRTGTASADALEIGTVAGVSKLELVGRDGTRFRFRANMGRPRIEPEPQRLEAGGRTWDATVVSMGNPHAVLFTDAFDASELRAVGPVLESHPRFPGKTNVELVEVLGGNAIRMGIWERGVGETASSGTGSSAAGAASIFRGLVDSPVEVRCPGGTMTVAWKDGEDLFLDGEAVVVAEGKYFGGGD